ncbi:MFS transporter [Brachybacterium fresconis]|uniref:MHS family metabolite:H+ symporter-like MFS transporter n=1 Tax=Brachybacterium fresconis TaxID=173363 RepID=A0ABS4YLZ5_9MICO|nr:MFS transporter [Brachybacterium fresconis]MBP2409774.1 MHS family metabolite:H+ symporter-like MFS transporter [Brachybacterium fresconis]
MSTHSTAAASAGHPEEPAGPVDPASPSPQPTRSVGDLVRAAVSGWLGTALEFMDFQLYSLAAALVFSEIFFAAGDPGMAVIGAMATYGVGYVARPVGAWYFGRMGDRIGRRKVLFYTIVLMGMATTLIGVLPTYGQVGLLAPALLVLLRLLQGLGAGAEISGAGVMLAEYAPVKRRGLVASLVALGTNCGTLFASAIWAVLLVVVTEQQLFDWAWRIPFIASALVMVFAVWVRLNLKESPVFEARDDVVEGEAVGTEEVETGEAPVEAQEFAATRSLTVKSVAVAFLLRFGQAGNSGMIQTYLITFMTVFLLLDKQLSTDVVIISSVVAFATVPGIGLLGDRFGRKTMYMIMSAIGVVAAIPCVLLIVSGATWQVIVGYVVLHNIGVMSLASMENLALPEIFGAKNRYQATGVVREIAAIVATGATPVIAAALVAATDSWIPVAVIIMFFSACALFAAIWMKEVAGRDLTDPNPAM